MRWQQIAIVVLRAVAFVLILTGSILLVQAVIRGFYYFDASRSGGGGGFGGGRGPAPASRWGYSIQSYMISNALCLLVPGVLLLAMDRRIVRWLVPALGHKCPGCGHGLAPHREAKCPECGLPLSAPSGAREPSEGE